MATKTKKTVSMDELVEKYGQDIVPISVGDSVEVEVLTKSKNKITVDVSGLASGVIPEKEFSYSCNDIKPGDIITASVLLAENENGFVILSLKQADNDRAWDILEEKKKNKENIQVKIKSANRGGLIAEYKDTEGFIPVSQLAPNNYPKVEGGNQSLILKKLQSFVGELMDVKVMSVDKNSEKLIFSEKIAVGSIKDEDVKNLKLGKEVEALITSIVDFGLFVKINIEKKEYDGLIHYSEITWDKQVDWKKNYKEGQKVKAVIISLKDGRLALSIKALEKNPWEKAEGKIKKGDTIEGKITSITPYGAFVEVMKNVEGMVHISNLGKKITDPNKVLEKDKKYKFEILDLDLKNKKISLKLIKSEKKNKTKKIEKKVTKNKTKATKSKIKNKK
ncbi:MAG: RNA binding S1 protein [uncultured bacterium]|uniref:RNA binding S1 domain protein n=1 Tax=Berkelbacteria bacterium GW2011_GWA2_35_9 TaxID=1618333 RepID=A0A0G0D3J6_9BACT|nr:MAG: RNA binding S1 protein [uncultured bacterium]KKP88749.1 MAG: RNA binding S1 domain protein [Berkelbacteria bacterium GW2011_GWA2_35_9]